MHVSHESEHHRLDDELPGPRLRRALSTAAAPTPTATAGVTPATIAPICPTRTRLTANGDDQGDAAIWTRGKWTATADGACDNG